MHIVEPVGAVLVSLWKKVLLSLLDQEGDTGNRGSRGRRGGERGGLLRWISRS